MLSAKFIQTQVNRFYKTTLFDFPKDLKKFIQTRSQYNLVIPVFHGKGGEDGDIQGFLKTLKMPFLFSDVAGHAVGIDKLLTKLIAQSCQIQQPSHQVVNKKQKIKYQKPVVIKPFNSGSSVDVFIVKCQKALDQGLKKIFKSSEKAIAEIYIQGEEYTVGVIEENNKKIALPIIWIKPNNKFFNYESKYTSGMAEEICPAPIDKKLEQSLKKIALLIHQTLGLKHMSRSDFIVDKKQQTYFLEVNTIPGLTQNSLIPKAVKTSGRDFGLLLKDWIQAELKKKN